MRKKHRPKHKYQYIMDVRPVCGIVASVLFLLRVQKKKQQQQPTTEINEISAKQCERRGNHLDSMRASHSTRFETYGIEIYGKPDSCLA